MISMNTVTLCYLLASVCFIQALKGLSHPASSRRGNLFGMVIGAFILTLIGNLVFAFKISSYWQPVAAGIVLLIAVLTSSIANASAKARAK